MATITVDAGAQGIGMVGWPVSFTSISSSTDGLDSFTYAWVWGDSTANGSTANPFHTFTYSGVFTITLTVTGTHSGSTGSATIEVVVTPNFGSTPTISSSSNGNWSVSGTWNSGRTPVSGDVVSVNSGTRVVFDANDSTNTNLLSTVFVSDFGTLAFSTSGTTQMCVANLQVSFSGTLNIGLSGNPVVSGQTATVVFGNVPINSGVDPLQFGTGLVAFGTVNTWGTPKTPWALTSVEPRSGDKTLTLSSAVSGWAKEDRLILPDTRQLPYTQGSSVYTPEWEQLFVSGMSPDMKTVTLHSGLTYDHLGGYDTSGALIYLPHVMNLTRNVVFTSQAGNLTGTRGYTYFAYRANIDIENTLFLQLGRSINSADPINFYNNSTFSSSGTATHYGTNQYWRYPVTPDFLIGPTNPQPNGYQATIVGNAVDNYGSGAIYSGYRMTSGGFQWGIALGANFWNLIQNNVVFNVTGAGIGQQHNAGSYNTFDSNFVLGVAGDGERTDIYLQGVGHWWANTNNYMTNNLASCIGSIQGSTQGTNTFCFGFEIKPSTGLIDGVSASPGATYHIPSAQGLDGNQAGQWEVFSPNNTPILQFFNNQVYGATLGGMTHWFIGTGWSGNVDVGFSGQATSVIDTLIAWNIWNRCLYNYQSCAITIQNCIFLGDYTQLSNANMISIGITSDDYVNTNMTVQNCVIKGFNTGINCPYFMGIGPTSVVQPYVVQNNTLCNRVNVNIIPAHSDDTTNMNAMQYGITANAFSCPPIISGQGADVSMDYGGTGGPQYNIPQTVYLNRYNSSRPGAKNLGENLQVFYSGTPAGTDPLAHYSEFMVFVDGKVVVLGKRPLTFSPPGIFLGYGK